MTEKKKRGRPPGSGKKKNDLPQNTEMILPGPIGTVAFTDGTTSEILQTKSDYQKGSLTITLSPRKPVEETPYPPNWNELGKVAKLQWLTANRK
jgi:hypothetical protein